MSDLSARSRSDAPPRGGASNATNASPPATTVVAFCAAEGVSQSNFYPSRAQTRY